MNNESDEHVVTEGEARRLLARAADTIAVDADAPMQLTGFPEPADRRRWPLVLAAAVAVVALVGAGLAAGSMLGRDGDAAPVDQASATDPMTDQTSASSGPSVGTPVPPSAFRRESADQFVAWARGEGDPPDFADSVRNLGPGFVGDPNTEPESREYWSGCSGRGFPACGVDPIASLLHDPSEIIALAGRVQCPWSDQPTLDPFTGRPSGLPARFLKPEAEADAVRLQPVGAAGCSEGTLINLWIHPDGEIYAVALVHPVLPKDP